MFLCYGQEEFFECKDDSQVFPVPTLHFSDMLEQKTRESISAEKKKESMQKD